MLCAVISGPTLAQVQDQLKQASAEADLAELRLDLWDDYEGLKELVETFPLPLIFTLRPIRQGGKYRHSEEQRLQELVTLAALQPAYIDLEYDLPLAFFQSIRERFPSIKLIASFHDFAKTPSDLESLLASLKELPVDRVKIATRAHSTLDALKILSLDKEYLALSMGEEGQITRILGPLYKSGWSYAPLKTDQATAPGQLSIQQLKEIYSYPTLSPSTAIYGLIGDPVSASIGHLFHNQFMRAARWDAVYVKMLVKPDELAASLEAFKKLGVRGLSVTMPLKEAVVAYLNESDPAVQQIGACNTLVFEEGCLKGYNTDGIGALKALEEVLDVRGKKMAIVGAGGAARAIAWEAIQRGVQVILLNRDAERAARLSRAYDCLAGSLEDLKQVDYDIIVNATPTEFDSSWLKTGVVAMDISPKSKLKNCVPWSRMYYHQAVGQIQVWGTAAKLPTEAISAGLAAAANCLAR